MATIEGDTEPYLQYAHVRPRFIIRMAEVQHEDRASTDLSLLAEQHAIDRVIFLIQ